MTIGTKVLHRSLGVGTVVELSPRRGAKVDFGYARTWVFEEEIEEDHEVPRPLRRTRQDETVNEMRVSEPAVVKSQAAILRTEEFPEDVVKAKREILALKLGHILEESVHDLSVGIDSIRMNLKNYVDDAVQGRPRSVLVEGAWGSGKTHILTLLTSLASRQGLATASVILDGEGVALSEPMGLMEAILGSLRYPRESVPRGIGNRLLTLRGQSQFHVERRLGWRLKKAIFDIPIAAFNESEPMEVLEDYFTLKLAATQAKTKLRQLGWRITLPPLRAPRVDERADRLCDLLKSWAEFCVLTGAKGLVVIFDELDVEYALATSGRAHRANRARLLSELGRLEDVECPLLIAFGSAPVSGHVEEENDAIRDVLRHVPWSKHVKAPRPTLEHTIELGRRLQLLYQDAYPDRTSGVDRHRVQQLIAAFAEQHIRKLDPTPRDFVRGTLERLDLAPNLADYSIGASTNTQ